MLAPKPYWEKKLEKKMLKKKMFEKKEFLRKKSKVRHEK